MRPECVVVYECGEHIMECHDCERHNNESLCVPETNDDYFTTAEKIAALTAALEELTKKRVMLCDAEMFVEISQAIMSNKPKE